LKVIKAIIIIRGSFVELRAEIASCQSAEGCRCGTGPEVIVTRYYSQKT